IKGSPEWRALFHSPSFSFKNLLLLQSQISARSITNSSGRYCDGYPAISAGVLQGLWVLRESRSYRVGELFLRRYPGRERSWQKWAQVRRGDPANPFGEWLPPLASHRHPASLRP